MSSRQLRRLQQQQEELAKLKDLANEESEEDDEPTRPAARPSAFSGFAALGGDDDEEEEDHADENDDGAEPAQEPVEAPTQVTTSKKSKKKKKKAKKNAKAPENGTKEAPGMENEDADEIDRALQELNLANKLAGGDSHVAASDSEIRAYERICELLRINTYHLKVINEMRNLFGREAIEAAHNEEEDEQTRNRRRNQRLQRNVDLETFLKGAPGKSLPEVTLRRNPFLLGKETWPRAPTEGLTMKQVKDGAVPSKAGTVEFGFAHDNTYNTLERQFFALVQMHDPMQLVYFLASHPYHVSTLIQVSKVAKQDQNSALAADLCERALFTCGRVSVSAFRQKIEEGKARLDFRRPENRQFWLAGYHYLKSLVMKGTYRTALEWTKLILAMDLTDPYGVIHFLHPLAIRAHESKWFIDFCDSEALDECDTAQDYVRQTLVLARLQQNDTLGAKALLVEGMERLPWLYSALFKALNLDVPKAIWGSEPRDEHELLFTELYVHQTKQLWDNAQATSLLKDAAGSATRPPVGALPSLPIAGRNIGRFVYLDNTPALMGLVPGGMLHAFPNWDFDPLPPPKEENIFSYDTQEMPWLSNIEQSARGQVELPGDRRQLLRLLERARGAGAPQDVQQALEQALGNMLDDEDEGNEHVGIERDDEDGDEGEEETEVRAERPPNRRALWQTFFDIFAPGVRDETGESTDDHAMPGEWVDEEDEDEDVHEAAHP